VRLSLSSREFYAASENTSNWSWNRLGTS